MGLLRSLLPSACALAALSAGCILDLGGSSHQRRDPDADALGITHEARRRVFVTDETFPPVFAEPEDRRIADVLARADARCQAAADRVSLGGTFRAWLYGAFPPDRVEPAARMSARGPYVLIDGRTVVFPGSAPTPQAATAPSMTETGARLGPNERAWVGGFLRGSCEGVVDRQLMSWSQANAGGQGAVGLPTSADAWADHFALPCTARAHLYCVEQ